MSQEEDYKEVLAKIHKMPPAPGNPPTQPKGSQDSEGLPEMSPGLFPDLEAEMPNMSQAFLPGSEAGMPEIPQGFLPGPEAGMSDPSGARKSNRSGKSNGKPKTGGGGNPIEEFLSSLGQKILAGLVWLVMVGVPWFFKHFFVVWPDNAEEKLEFLTIPFNEKVEPLISNYIFSHLFVVFTLIYALIVLIFPVEVWLELGSTGIAAKLLLFFGLGVIFHALPFVVMVVCQNIWKK